MARLPQVKRLCQKMAKAMQIESAPARPSPMNWGGVSPKPTRIILNYLDIQNEFRYFGTMLVLSGGLGTNGIRSKVLTC